MNKRLLPGAAAAMLSTLLIAGTALADGPRNYLYIVGSTTIAPFSEEVASRIAKSAKFKHPLLESNGTSGGFTMFCEGTGMDYPDIIDASRPIKKSEFTTCQKNGVGDIVEVKIGYDGIVIASSKKAKPMELTRKDLYLALAKSVPDTVCKETCDKLIPNPYKTWKQVNPSLPDVKIDVYGPPFNSGSSEVFSEAVLESGCNIFPWLRAMRTKNEKEYYRNCHNFREDGVYTQESGELIPSRLDDNLDSVGIINFNRLKENASHLKAAKLEGVAPSYESIASQNYAIARPLFFYVKKAHVDRLPGFRNYLAEFTSEKASGPNGYLLAKGLVGMSPQELKAYAADVKELKPMVPPN
ncbi:MAG: phosphate ABC transporter substrate-binding protein [Candidatus Methylumidiphilus alinenensis]|uniref:Phosphate ABC transporter substrate-binding protein n=1 Tax=Candidatus Methylumidiphilus alinenensis TaxID=2202197 RepID=A0A2W4QZG7_9GAMM|nr:MAG: phosphate ABC transporter substrate-binding protein [Candidatus Methylumidiphilus alinenensis]